MKSLQGADGFIRGNPNLKAPDYTEYVSKEEAEFRVKEIIKCKNDIAYFANTYFTIIHLKRGKEIIKMYPEQEEMVKMMSENDRTIVSASRQVGKCVYKDTKIKIRNKKTKEIEEITFEEFFKLSRQLGK